MSELYSDFVAVCRLIERMQRVHDLRHSSVDAPVLLTINREMRDRLVESLSQVSPFGAPGGRMTACCGVPIKVAES